MSQSINKIADLLKDMIKILSSMDIQLKALNQDKSIESTSDQQVKEKEFELKIADHVPIEKGMCTHIKGDMQCGKTSLISNLLNTIYSNYKRVYCSTGVIDFENYLKMDNLKVFENHNALELFNVVLEKQEHVSKESVLFVIDNAHIAIDSWSLFCKQLIKAKALGIDVIISTDHRCHFDDKLFEVFLEKAKKLRAGKITKTLKNICSSFMQAHNILEGLKTISSDHLWVCAIDNKTKQDVFTYIFDKKTQEKINLSNE